MKLILKALAGSTNCPENKLNLLNGIDCQDDFAEYSDFSEKLESGYMHFSYNEGKLYTITEYEVKEKLTETEILDIIEETQGQWSDGIGEGFEQYPCTEIDGEEIYISPWFHGQIVEYKLIEDVV